jgi:hypothetical protein
MDKFIQTISSIADSVIDWISLHPKAALVIAVFIIGFIVGSLF